MRGGGGGEGRTSHVVLSVGLNPVESKSVQESGETLRSYRRSSESATSIHPGSERERERDRKRKEAHLHDAKDRKRQDEPGRKHEDDEESVEDANLRGLGREGGLEGHVVEDFGKLGVSEGKSPESQVGGGVGDASYAGRRRFM